MEYIINDVAVRSVSKTGKETEFSVCGHGEAIIDKYELRGVYSKKELIERLEKLGPVFEEKEAIRIARWCKKNGFFAILKAVYDVSAVWEDLKNRRIHPGGEFDSGGRFYSDFDGLGEGVRSPSRSWPYSQMTAARTEVYAMACALANRGV